MQPSDLEMLLIHLLLKKNNRQVKNNEMIKFVIKDEIIQIISTFIFMILNFKFSSMIDGRIRVKHALARPGDVS